MARGAAAGLSLPSWHGREGIGIALARMDVAMSVEFADLCCALQWCYGFRAHAEGNLADAVRSRAPDLRCRIAELCAEAPGRGATMYSRKRDPCRTFDAWMRWFEIEMRKRMGGTRGPGRGCASCAPVDRGPRDHRTADR